MSATQRLILFYDYTCPYCLRAHQYLMDCIGQFPGLEIVWLPTEAHPRPETYGMHSDLLCQAFFFARDHQADIPAVHRTLYNAALVNRTNIERIDEVCSAMRSLVDAAALRQALESGQYAEENRQTNHLAYDLSGVWALPAYRFHDQRLDSREGIGVSQGQLQTFLMEHYKAI